MSQLIVIKLRFTSPISVFVGPSTCVASTLISFTGISISRIPSLRISAGPASGRRHAHSLTMSFSTQVIPIVEHPCPFLGLDP